VSRVAYLANPDNASTMATLAEMKHAAASAAMTLIGVEVGSATDFDDAFTAMLRERPDARLVSNDPLHQLHIDWIIAFLAQHRLPGMFYAKENVVAGGFMA
jgi:putative ABC transport system substrate-binding protein